ncbi:DEAD/DEAH box helicase [Treponema putidum]|uniref:DEAD/DEAH box helicase n=1 Tax=Treponema putidum TaxID=221027 RepID=UPI002102B8A6|nr:AAA domain-containing protein [Treponema putidum]UTY30303.1 DNA helicase [Treponema putidum]
MDKIARQIFRAAHEGKWLSIEYRNKKFEQISRFWIGIKNILKNKNGILDTLQCSGLHIHDYTLEDNMQLSVERILSANIVDGTYMPINKDLIDDIACNPAKYQYLFYGSANYKILNYLADCNKFESVPSLNNDFCLIENLDDSIIISNPLEYPLSVKQYQEIVDAFNKRLRTKQKKYQEAGQLCLNKLSLYTRKGLYVLAYREVFLDVEKHTLKVSNEISFNKEFYVKADSKDGKIESIRRFFEQCELYLLNDFDKNLQKIEDIIQDKISKEKIDDRPYFLYLKRNAQVNLEKEYDAILSMYKTGDVSVPIRAFFGELHTVEKNGNDIPITLLNKKINLDQLLSIRNAMNSPVSYTQGPPGTGKTNTIINTIITAFFNNKTVLFSSYNNHPIDTVFQTLSSLQYKRQSGNVDIIPFPVLRLGSNEKVKEALNYIKALYQKCKNIKVYGETLERNKKDTIKQTKKLSELLKNHQETVELAERKDTLKAMLEKNTSMEMRLVLEGQQLNAIRKRLSEIPKVSDQDALNLLEKDENEFLKYLYYTSAGYIQRLAEPDYDDLRLILKLEKEEELITAFNKYTSVDDNICKLQKIFPIIATTCISAHKLGNGKCCFDCTIIDEASQCNTALSLIPIIRGKTLMLVGDPQQLNPVITLDENINKSLKEKYGVSDDYDYITNSIYKTFLANDSISEEILLHNHYRCNREIIQFNNEKYYNNQLNIVSESTVSESLVFYNVDSTGNNFKNTSEKEAEEIVKYINNNRDKKIGIITPFRNQKEQIEYSLKTAGINSEKYSCGTVHAFQGDEKDVILFSLALTDSTHNKTYEWLKNNRELINVATSRAKDRLVIFSNSSVINRLHRNTEKTKPDDIYELAEYVRNNGSYTITNCTCNSRALGTKPYKTETEEEFLATLNHALSTIFLENKKYCVETEVQPSHIFKKGMIHLDYFYRCSFDFVIYKLGYRNKKEAVLAIELNGREHYNNKKIMEHDKMKKEICKEQGFTLITVENSYARRYNFIRDVLIGYFEQTTDSHK